MAQKQMVYLDYHATAPLRPQARAAMLSALEACGNASSVHAAGRAARSRLDSARQAVAQATGAAPGQVVFTSGGTESNGLALAQAGALPVLVAATEHESVLSAAPAGSRRLPVLRSGLLDLDALEAALERPAFVSVMAANNETGVLQPVDRIAALVHARGGLLHVDAVQALGKVDLTGCPADFISLSAHKIGGPPGAGALVIRPERAPQPLLRGGGQESGWRAGTENVPALAGFAAALGFEDWQAAAARLRDDLESRIGARVPEAPLLSGGAARLCSVALLWMPGVPAETQVMAFDLAGFAVSAGSACSSGKVRQSHVLTAMGYDATVASECVRVSLGWDTQEAEIIAFGDAWLALHGRLARRAA